MAGERRCLVLVVEDDAAQRYLLRDVLEAEGYEAVTADDGSEALRFVAWRQPDVVLLDLMMPVVDGFGFARAYAEQPGSRARLVVMSASNLDLAEAQAASLGAAYVAKPYDLDALMDLVAELAHAADCRPDSAA